MFAYAIYATVRSLLRTLTERRDQRRLDEVGLSAAGQVATVEPMQRRLNGAAGHPVQLAFQDRAGQPRLVRDTTGLGGYVVRAGTPVAVRYSPTDFVLATGGGVFVLSTDFVEVPEFPDSAVPAVFGVIGLGLLIGNVAFAIRRASRRRHPMDEAMGVVTEVWSESSGSGSTNRRHAYWLFHLITIGIGVVFLLVGAVWLLATLH
jgi:hypothetical protein